MVKPRTFGFLAGSLLLAVSPAAAAAKDEKPALGSWRIEQTALADPIKVRVGKDMTQILEQRVVPEAAVLTGAPVTFAAFNLPAGAGLIHVTTKKASAWCAIDPLRVHPGAPKTSFGQSLLMGRKIVQSRRTPCFADTDGDSRMDVAMLGSERGYVLPTIEKLEKPVPIKPFAVRETNPSEVVSFPLRLSAATLKYKDEPGHLTFALSIHSGDVSSQLEGFGLVQTSNGRVSFAMFSGVASIRTVFEEPGPAMIAMTPVDLDGTSEVTISATMAARRFGLGNISTF